jgi:hypothetical protein
LTSEKVGAAPAGEAGEKKEKKEKKRKKKKERRYSGLSVLARPSLSGNTRASC